MSIDGVLIVSQSGGTKADTYLMAVGEQALGFAQAPHLPDIADAWKLGTNDVSGSFNHLLYSLVSSTSHASL